MYIPMYTRFLVPDMLGSCPCKRNLKNDAERNLESACVDLTARSLCWICLANNKMEL